MVRLRNKISGSYIISFFEMYINTNSEDMVINELPIKDMTVLFHEYIHFLQDFTTYYGLNNIYCHSEYLHSVVNRIYKLNSDNFIVPFKIEDNEDNEDNVLLNNQICKLTSGDDKTISQCIIKEIFEIEDELMKNIHIESISSITLYLDNENLVSFGSIAIMESMAYILEQCCSPNGYISSPDFPYNAAAKVADYYVTDFSSNKLMLLALCDMSLQSFNPGACFVRVMKDIQSGSLKFDNPEAIYDYFYRKKVVKLNHFHGNTFIECFKSLAETIRGLLKSYLKDMPILKSFYDWIDKLIDFSIDWRENDRYFLLKMARHEDLATNNYWGQAVYDVGTPLMSNNSKGKYYKIPPYTMTSTDMNVEYFKAIHEIMKIFEHGATSCSMYEWCSKSPNSTPNDLCKISPWQKCNEEKLCPLAFVWKHWKLTNKVPKNNQYSN